MKIATKRRKRVQLSRFLCLFAAHKVGKQAEHPQGSTFAGKVHCLPMRNASFPLTLALSLREREQLSTLSDVPTLRLPAPRRDFVEALRLRTQPANHLPLPTGERRGEGNERAHRRNGAGL
ncbi:MAG: hypothetical protein DME19_06055 [Verrucomicrobia bacterium]|nr:MAG: hypothetical protein DME19_06055 [Verrucomicrobiota bacterium]